MSAAEQMPIELRAETSPAPALLEVRNLTVDYLTPRGPARAVDQRLVLASRRARYSGSLVNPDAARALPPTPSCA